jgi:hypothetical protein
MYKIDGMDYLSYLRRDGPGPFQCQGRSWLGFVFDSSSSFWMLSNRCHPYSSSISTPWMNHSTPGRFGFKGHDALMLGSCTKVATVFVT